jgi:acyl carrier protein phosphodiesterase
MNYLAHAFLSGEDPEFLLGNISADMLKGNIHKKLPVKISAGVQHHRIIDTFTDNHAQYRSCLPNLYAIHGKYASVVLDILFDFYLVKNWHFFSDVAFESFCEKTNILLSENISDLPIQVATQLRAMIQGNWLFHYGYPEGLAYCFSRLSKRVSRPDLLEHWQTTLNEQGAFLESGFLLFFPDLLAFSQKQANPQNVGIW